MSAGMNCMAKEEWQTAAQAPEKVAKESAFRSFGNIKPGRLPAAYYGYISCEIYGVLLRWAQKKKKRTYDAPACARPALNIELFTCSWHGRNCYEDKGPIEGEYRMINICWCLLCVHSRVNVPLRKCKMYVIYIVWRKIFVYNIMVFVFASSLLQFAFFFNSVCTICVHLLATQNARTNKMRCPAYTHFMCMHVVFYVYVNCCSTWYLIFVHIVYTHSSFAC